MEHCLFGTRNAEPGPVPQPYTGFCGLGKACPNSIRIPSCLPFRSLHGLGVGPLVEK
jgi:hypothetical protein